MTIQEWLTTTSSQLGSAGIDTARLDALVLLSDELGHDKSWVLGHPEHALQGSEIKKLSTKIIQRTQHIPLAYIRGIAEFYGRTFTVNEHVLVPRPESEAMIELLKKLPIIPSTTIIDIGTGSGALAITAALELPTARIVATDIDPSTLTVARNNAKQLHAAITFLQGDVLQPIIGVDPNVQNAVVLANLPYVPTTYPTNRAAAHEPSLALFGGSDGLELYKKLCAQLMVFEHKPTTIITESLVMQHPALTELMKATGYNLVSADGLAQCFVHKH